MERLHHRIRIVWSFGAVRRALFLAVLAGIGGLFLLDGARWPGPVAFAVVGILGVLHALARYRAWGYELREDDLFIRRGVFTQVRTVVPFVRVQHVDTRRSPTERALDLSRVVVYTAGSRQADVSIPGLTPEDATELQKRLRDLAVETESDDAV
jgi:membrane protein YdbS with pleckstrin-like domain